jgi:phage baseplate assembly protein W
MAQTNVYTDINLDFEPHPVTGDVVKLKDANAVKRSVRNLVLMNQYEHPYDTTLGTGVRELLFENHREDVSLAIKNKVQYVIEKFEPRVELISVTVDDSAENVDKNSLGVTIRFFVGSSQTPDELQIFLERVR